MDAAAEALLLAQRGELEQAEALARTAVATAETKTDHVWWQAWTHEGLATVLERAGRTDEAREALERALAYWERKRCLPCAQRVRDQIASLGQKTRQANGARRTRTTVSVWRAGTCRARDASHILRGANA